MACPFFHPLERDQRRRWIHAPRLPLGAWYRGVCKAGQDRFETDGDLCNCGYARGLCERFPAEAQSDAVRFSLDGESKFVCIEERNHAPLRYESFAGAPNGNEILIAQAWAFAENHPRRNTAQT